MTIDLYTSAENYVTVELAEVGSRVSNSFDNGVFQSKGGAQGQVIASWSEGVQYTNLGITLGTKLNDIDVTGVPDPLDLAPDPAQNNGLIFSNYTFASGYIRFSYGSFTPNIDPIFSVRMAETYDQPTVSYASCYLAHAKIDGVDRIGFLGIDDRSSSYWSFMTPQFIYDEYVSDLLLSFINKEPGSKGYNPTKTKYKKKGTGGKGHNPRGGKNNIPSYETDTLQNPGAPDESGASAIRSGFLHAYDVNAHNLRQFGACLFGSTFLTALTGLLINPLDFVVSLNIFPTDPNINGVEAIKLGQWECAINSQNGLGADANGAILSSQFKVVHFGKIDIYENWGSFLDYTNTQIELYLPFIGCVDIDTAEVMNGSIDLDYTIDFFTGMCVANVCCNRTVETPDGEVYTQYAQHSYQGNCAINVPLSQIQYGNMIGSLINAGTTGLRSGVPSGVIALGSDMLSGGLKPSVTTKGTISANAGYCSILRPYVKITRPISAESDSFQEVMGYPSYVDSTLGECEDLCICESIDLHSVSGATDNELNRIRQMCLEGVHV